MPDDPGLKLARSLWTKAEAIHQKERIESRVKRLALLYRSRSTSLSEERSDPNTVFVNKVFPMVRASIASLFAKRPDVIVKPTRPDFAMGAQAMEVLLRWLTHSERYPRTIRTWLRSAFLYQFGCLKIGSGEEGIPWIESYTPDMVRGDPGQSHFFPEEGRYVSFKFVRTLSALRASGQYDEAKLDELREGMKKHLGSESFEDSDTPMTFWEHYVRDGNDILIVTQPNESGMNLREEGETFVKDAGLPVRTLSFNETDDTYYPVAISELFLDQLKEKNVLRTQQLLHAERSNSLTLYDANRFSKEELEKVQRNEPKMWAGTDGPPGEIVESYNQGNLSSDVYAGEARVDLDLQEGFGLGSLQMGSDTKTASRSATEASIVEGNLRLRSSDRQEVFEDALESLYAGIGALAQRTLAKQVWMMVTEHLPLVLDRKAIQGEFRYQLSFGSTLPTDRTTERSDAMLFLRELGPLAFGPDPKIRPDRLLAYVLQKFGVKDATDWIVRAVPAPAPAPAPTAPPAGPVPAGPPPALASLLNGASIRNARAQGTPLDLASMLRRVVGGRG